MLSSFNNGVDIHSCINNSTNIYKVFYLWLATRASYVSFFQKWEQIMYLYLPPIYLPIQFFMMVFFNHQNIYKIFKNQLKNMTFCD